ncbi:Acyl-CoA dehydrogenase NM domain-like protein [Mycena venus]|uniref:Acyl-CoA dehydrogenase NM domain-like protein n=1 Tax=Mycena venus TaxID=2733690 RepID=A0A8H6X8V3_9AGAR|nr:Acyl-CoA dehydrogenase NM domain-like protein [Mycena venus]
MRPSESLCPSFRHDLFRNYVDPKIERARMGIFAPKQLPVYMVRLTLDDIMSLSPKFWDMHTDPIICLDGAATTLLTIQYNLAAGTLGAFVSERDDILALVKDIIDFRTIGQFCLTELEHGLDAFNLETTAVLLDDGRFELHTPHPGAAKFMPPTTPVLGRPCFAVVFAQLLAKGICQGIRPFVVCLNDGFKMCPGISARILPQRGNSAPVNHCLTTFDRVILPSSALLGDMIISGPPRLHFLSSIWRVAVGTLALTSIAIPGLAIASHIALQYSLRRLVRGNDGDIIPIFNFRTQQTPILTTIAQAFVLRAFHQQAVRHFVDDGLSPFVQHGIATCFKAVVVRDTLGSHSTLSERCGAQGLFGYNRLIVHHDEMRGVAIAEGDVLVLSIRLATELLLEKYSLPPPENFSSLLALHEDGLLTKYKSVTTNDGGHRSAKFGSHVMPHCERIVRAIGYRMAYDAAVSAKVPQGLIDLFVCNVVKADLGWMSLPHVEKWVAEMEVEPYVASPIISKAPLG